MHAAPPSSAPQEILPEAEATILKNPPASIGMSEGLLSKSEQPHSEQAAQSDAGSPICENLASVFWPHP